MRCVLGEDRPTVPLGTGMSTGLDSEPRQSAHSRRAHDAQSSPRTKEDREVIITEFWCPGRPKTKGSLDIKTGVPRDTEASKAWRRLMAGACRDDLRRRHPQELEAGSSYPGPVAVTAYWFLPKPPTDYQAGDIDKLLRNLLDALSARTDRTTDRSLCAGAIVDDNQVQGIPDSWEFYDPDQPGVLVEVRDVDDREIGQRRQMAMRRRAALTA